MSDFEDTTGDAGYYDGTVEAAAVSSTDGLTAAPATSADLAATSFEATDASFAAWGNSIEADSYATAAYDADDQAGVEYWNSVSDAYEQQSYAADSAADATWDASWAAQSDEDAAYDTGYAGYESGSAGYDPSSSWAATDTVTDYYTDADW